MNARALPSFSMGIVMKVVVIGGGASGLMAAYAAAENGNDVTLVEKNEKLGKKIYITGKGRCNVTNDCAPDEFLQNVVHGEKFMRGAIYRFPPQRLMDFLEREGLPLTVERGNRVFPASNHASDVTKTLEKACKRVGVTFDFNTEVLKIDILHSTMRDVITNKGILECDVAILATGGLSYPSTGSTGDGYRIAGELGHTIVPCKPSLTGLNCRGDFMAVQGVSVKNAVLTAKQGSKVIFSELGELLFTHYGVSGPLVLTLSALVNRMSFENLSIFVDFKPALDDVALEMRLKRDLSERKNEQMKSVIRGLLPASLGISVLEYAHIPLWKQANALTKEKRRDLLHLLKAFPLYPVSLRGFNEAVVTSGGVDLKEVDPRTMESKKIKGLYLCGEVLDIDAFTGGFNLQLAFATGYMAGKSVGTK